jgi:hypothetical protein
MHPGEHGSDAAAPDDAVEAVLATYRGPYPLRLRENRHGSECTLLSAHMVAGSLTSQFFAGILASGPVDPACEELVCSDTTDGTLRVR